MRGVDLRRRSFLLGTALLAPIRRLWAQVLHPRYREQIPLDATLLKTNAQADDFPAEKYHDRIAAILRKWSDGQPIESSLAADFKGGSLTPAETKIVRPGPALEVKRIVFRPITIDREAFIEELRAWRGEFLTADFQITAINGTKTRVRYEIVGSGPGFHREQRIGYWQLDWNDQHEVRTLQTEPETRSRSAHPWYADITEQALGPTPMLRGVDHWRTVLDSASGIDVYGHNGVSVGDIDGSGFDSIYVCQPAGLPNRLYRNRGDGTFEDITANSGVDLLDNTACALFADFNNDGHQDLLVVRATGPLLFLNQGGGRFRMQPDAFRFAKPPQGTFTGAAAADYDRDGWLDIYFCLYTFYQGADQYNYPTPYYAAENGPPNYLMRNNRDGTFRDATAEAGLNVNNTRFSFCCAWGDHNNDGWPDLYVVNDFGGKNLYRNNGDGTFTDIAHQAGVEDTGAGMGACWVDYDNDGVEDLYVANMWTAAGERIASQDSFQSGAPAPVRALYRKHAMGNSLFRNRGDGTFENSTMFDGGGMGRWAWSCDAWDFDHDGFPDLYIANGMISGPQRDDLNSFFWRQVVANSPNEARSSPEYEQGWNAVNELIRADNTWSGYERNVFYANNRDGTFSDVSGAVDLDFIEDGRSFALADFDGDGRVEILVKSRNAPELRLLKNVVPELPPSIAFRLTGHAIGASITVGHQTRRIQAGSGFLSQHSKELMFGLGDGQGPITATIRWPGGAVQTLRDLPANHRIHLGEGSEQPRIEAFLKAPRVEPANPELTKPSPTNVETWLLTPVPMPGTSPGKPRLIQLQPDTPNDEAAICTILFRHIFDRRRDITLPTSFLLNEAGEIVKVYRGPPRENDISRIPETAEQRFALALPYPGNATTYAYGRNYLSLAAAYFQRGYLEPSESFFQLALKDDPASAEAHYGLGSIYLRRDKRIEARAHFEQAVKLNASYRDTPPNAWNNLGLLATREGHLDEAVRCFEQALKLSPDYWISLENLGNAYKQQGRTAEARKTLERALELRPKDPSANYSLAMLFAQADDAGHAEQYLQQALALKPDYAEALNNLGILYLRTRRRDEAVAKFEEAIRLAPTFDQPYLNLAQVYAIENSKDNARAVLEQLLTRHPGHPQGIRLRDQLK